MATLPDELCEVTAKHGSAPVAVIDIGTTSIRMAIAEIDPDGNVRTLDTLSQTVNLGKDTFTSGQIKKSTIEDCVRVLKVYRQKLEEYGIDDPEHIRVIATSAVREARNRLAFLDRVFIATGIEVEPLEEAEVNGFTYLGIRPFLESEPSLLSSQTIVIEVGGGSTEILVVKRGDVVFAQTYRLGALRLKQTLERYRAPESKQRGIMEGQIERTIEEFRHDIIPAGQLEMIALGGDIRFATRQLIPDWDTSSLARIPVTALEKLTDELLALSVDEIVRRFHLSFADAETVGPALLAYVQLAQAVGLTNLVVTDTNLRDGLLQNFAAQHAWMEEFSKQVLRSTIDLGRKFDFDENHAKHVAMLAKSLFSQLQEEHQLDAHFELILHVAALLHEIGNYISMRSRHKHSMYLIQNSELFGLGQRNLLLVALVARYHRRASPQPRHDGYSRLSREERVTVSKLAAILRIAVALDTSRSQRIHEVQCSIEKGRLLIAIPNIEDLSLEQLEVTQNASLVEEVFGLQVLLRTIQN
ncbi:MAG: Ppx/GppA family phosphatase [Pirellulaceae bacterium]|nr:Ppx/GppA family phosphatase [Pirellulaceae bacterium]